MKPKRWNWSQHIMLLLMEKSSDEESQPHCWNVWRIMKPSMSWMRFTWASVAWIQVEGVWQLGFSDLIIIGQGFEQIARVFKEMQRTPKSLSIFTKCPKEITQHIFTMVICMLGHRHTWSFSNCKGSTQVLVGRHWLLHQTETCQSHCSEGLKVLMRRFRSSYGYHRFVDMVFLLL